MQQNYFCDEGNLGHDPILKYFPVQGKSGATEQRPVIEMQVRFDYRELNKQTGEYEDTAGYWAQVNLWGKRAEFLNKHLRKGCRVLVIGELKQHEFIRQQGERKGQVGNALHIEASTIALILVGVEQVIFEAKTPVAHSQETETNDHIDFSQAE